MKVCTRSATPFFVVGAVNSRWNFQNIATRSYSFMWCFAVGLNSCKLVVWGAVAKPFNRWHNLLGVISGPPTFKDAWARVSPVGSAVKGGALLSPTPDAYPHRTSNWRIPEFL